MSTTSNSPSTSLRSNQQILVILLTFSCLLIEKSKAGICVYMSCLFFDYIGISFFSDFDTM